MVIDRPRRLDGWEARLDAVIEAARHEPYALGHHDCFRLACGVIQALTGIDRWSEFSGSYRTKREALAAIAAHGATFEAAGDWFFGYTRVDWRHARRGDIVALQTADGEKHLGVCLGWQAAYLAPEGLVFLPVSGALCAWRVG